MKYHMKLVSATMCCLQNTVMCDHSLGQESLSKVSVTETYTQTDAVQSDPYLQLCSAGDKEIPNGFLLTSTTGVPRGWFSLMVGR